MTNNAVSPAIIPAMPDRGTVWRRRVLLMAVVALLVAIPVTIAIRGGDDEDGSSTSVATSPPLTPVVSNKGLKVSYQIPEGWRESKKAKAIQLQSRDRSALIAIAAPAVASKAGSLLDDTLATFRSEYKGVEIRPGSGKQVGGLEVKGAVIAAKSPDGDQLRIVVAVARGKRRAYLVEVFTAADAPVERVREAQVALNSLRLMG